MDVIDRCAVKSMAVYSREAGVLVHLHRLVFRVAGGATARFLGVLLVACCASATQPNKHRVVCVHFEMVLSLITSVDSPFPLDGLTDQLTEIERELLLLKQSIIVVFAWLWPVAGADLLRENSTADCLVAGG